MFKNSLLVVALLFSATAFANPRFVQRQNPVLGEYIVVLRDETPYAAVDGIAKSLASAYRGSVKQVWKDSAKAFHFVGSEGGAVGMLDDPRVEYVEQNAISYYPRSTQEQGAAADATVASSDDKLSGEKLSVSSAASTPYWHLDRLDDSSPFLDGTYNMTTEARSVYAYVIDTGVWAGHAEFQGRVGATLDFSQDRGTTGLWNNDQTGGCTTGAFANPDAWHGTAVASLISGSTVGAARTQIISLKVARCSDLGVETASIFRAIDFIASSTYNNWHHLPGVINLSMFVVPGDSNYSVIRDAARATVQNTGFPFFTSADNWAGDACQFSPNMDGYTAANPWGRVFVVGGTMLEAWNWPLTDDFRWQNYDSYGPRTGVGEGSNTGSCVSLFAPAKDVTAARHSAFASAYGTETGTSFSSPLAAAIAARYIEKQIAVTGVRPSYSSVYGFLRGNAIVSVLDRGFTPYDICVRADTFRYWTQPPGGNGTCSAGYTLVHMNPTATSGKMLYYQE